jgi:hypothetical protein
MPTTRQSRLPLHVRNRPPLSVQFVLRLKLRARDVMAQECLITTLGSVTSLSYRSIFA